MKFEGFRSDVERYFKMSGIRETSKLNHSPFIVLNGNSVEICDSARELLEKYEPETNVMGQWRGQWSSDFFHFTVGEFAQYVKDNPKADYEKV